MKRCGTLTWLWCMWRVARTYGRNGLLFSRRLKFMEELRPLTGGNRIEYPEAIFWVTPEDVNRALSVVNK